MVSNKTSQGCNIGFYQNLKDQIVLTLHISFQSTDKKVKLPNSFEEENWRLIIISKNSTKNNNYTPVPFLNINAKILNEMSASRIQNHSKTMVHFDQVRFIPEMQVLFHIMRFINAIDHINRSEGNVFGCLHKC